jgi:sulfatase modifying factor 1
LSAKANNNIKAGEHFMFREIHFLKKSLSIFVTASFVVLLMSTTAWGLSPKLEAKKNWLMVEKALEKEDYSKAVSYLEKMKRLGVELQPEYYFQYGRSLIKSGKFKEGLELLNSYIEKAGDDGEYVEWTLELMGEAEEPQAPPGMVLIPGGEFVQGEDSNVAYEECRQLRSDCKRISYERVGPKHTVQIDDFFFDKYEVTQGDYKKVTGKYIGFPKEDNLPVSDIDWHRANDYCEKLGKRLPTEAEWEKAARGGTTTKYYWGDEYDGAYAWTRENSGNDLYPKPVGQKVPNQYGLYDILGNVREWTLDWYDENYYKNAPRNNPKGPSNGKDKVLRGGSWEDSPAYVQPSVRYFIYPSAYLYSFGFRCAQ